MQLLMLGLNHNTAPVSVREKMSVPADQLEQAYRSLLNSGGISEALVLSTCNRVEYYVVSTKNMATSDLLRVVSSRCDVGVDTLGKHTYTHAGTSAINHMVMVASGIDSLVMGEPQIFGQVKDAFRGAREHKALGAYLNRLEQFVLNTTKHVRTDTGIAENAVSVSYAAVDLAKKIFGSLAGRNALVIGAGEMCELAAEHLAGSGIGHITVTNRTFDKAEALARRFDGTAITFDVFPEELSKMDIIISSTGAPFAVVTKAMVEKAMHKRKKSPMFFIDIAVPRDVEQSVNEIDNTYVYDIDDLKQVVDANRKERESEADKAKELIVGAVARFERKVDSLSADKLIVEIRRNAANAAQLELERYCTRNNVTDPTEMENLKYMLTATINKIMHSPSVNMRNFIADKKNFSFAEAATLLFDLKDI